MPGPVPRSPARRLLRLAPWLAFMVCLACAGEMKTPPRLVVLYATCSLNRDHLSPYRADVDYTPHLGRFAAEGVVFERHQTETGISGPSFAALFTGTHADRHGIYTHPQPLSTDVYLITEAFADAGYETFFWSGHVMAHASLRYGQGVPPGNVVDFAKAPPEERRSMLTESDPRFRAVLERLEKDPDYRAFIQINFTVTHSPYERNTDTAKRNAFADRHPALSGPLADRDLDRMLEIQGAYTDELSWNFPAVTRRLGLGEDDVSALAAAAELCYAVSVEELDRMFGGFLEALDDRGLRDHSCVVFTADHGEILYRDNALFKWTHGKQLCPEVLNIPWILRAPGVTPGRFSGVSRSIDVFPTLAGLCGLDLPKETGPEGVDLLSVPGDGKPSSLTAFSHTSLISEPQWRRTGHLTLRNTVHPLQHPRYLWILRRTGDLAARLERRPDEEWSVAVFDWSGDPEERTDLFDRENPAHAEAVRELLAYRDRLTAAYPDAAEETRVPEGEALERLRSLGYVN